MIPHRYTAGDKADITFGSIGRMWDSNRSSVTAGYPSVEFIRSAEGYVGAVGEITHTFPPGYEVTFRVEGHSFHMKDQWIEPVA